MMDNPFAAYSTKIFTVFLWAYNDCMWERCDPTSFFCEVYDRMEFAVQAGQEELTRQIQRLKEEFTADQNKSFDIFVRDKVNYLFMVKEQYLKHVLFSNPSDEKETQNWIKKCQDWGRQLVFPQSHVSIPPETDLYQLCSQQSEYIEYRFDYTGVLISRLESRGGGGYYLSYALGLRGRRRSEILGRTGRSPKKRAEKTLFGGRERRTPLRC